jgi:hypothetical protein
MPFAAQFPFFHGRSRVHSPFFRVEAPVPVIVFLFVSLFLLLAAMAAYGQTPAPHSSQPAVLQSLSYGSECPLNLSAQQGMSAELRTTRPGQKDTPTQSLSQQIRLTVANPRPIGINAARIKVHGYTPTARAFPLAPPSPDAAKSLDLVLTVAPGQDAATDLRLEGFSAVTSIELVSVSYADGTRWQAAAETHCQIAPDPVMLITSR